MIAYSTDHMQRGLGRLLAQFRGKQNIEAIAGAWLVQIQEAEDALYGLMIARWLPNAVGQQLDVLGRIVGQQRGGRSDDIYRLWIAARSLVNRSSGLTEQVIDIVKKLVGTDVGVLLQEEPPAGFSVIAEDPIEAETGPEIAKLVRLAKAAGVRANFEWHAAGAFQFSDDEDEMFDAAVGFNAGELASVSSGSEDVTLYEPPSLTDLLGSALLACWEVPADEDDPGITVISGRVQSIASSVGGNALEAPGASQRPHYRTGSDGPNGEPYLEVALGLRLEALIDVAADNRACLYVVMMVPSDPGGVRDTVTLIGSGNTRVRIDGSANRYQHVQSFSNDGEVTLSITDPEWSFGRWRLHALRPIASGARSSIDGAMTTPNFDTSDTATVIESVLVGAFGNAAGAVKAIYLVDDASDDVDGAIFEYVNAKGWLS